MITVFKILGRIGLLLTIAPACLYLFDQIDLDRLKLCMTIGMVAWFVGATMASRVLSPTDE